MPIHESPLERFDVIYINGLNIIYKNWLNIIYNNKLKIIYNNGLNIPNKKHLILFIFKD